MPPHSLQTTHTARGAASRTARGGSKRQSSPGHLLTFGQIVSSPETRVSYRIGRLLGSGGFGQVFMAARLGRSSIPSEVCIKISSHMDGWIREAYFGLLLKGHPRAIQVYDKFVTATEDGQVLYCLVMECAKHGDLSAFLSQSPKAWSETAVRREIAGVLDVLRKLHRGQLLHRDLTPMNVFVCDGPQLKLGDFGIVRHQSDQRGVTARTMNAMTAPSEIIAGTAPKWQARDDVYQVGQLLGMLVRGDARARLRTGDVRNLRCGDHLKEIIHRCIGERRKRYETADEMIEALKNPPAGLKAGALRSLKGMHIAFTGFLSKPRAEAVRSAKARRRNRSRWPLGQDQRHRPRPSKQAAGGWGLRWVEADGDEAVARARAADHAAQRSAVLAPGGEAIGVYRSPFTRNRSDCVTP